MVARHDDDLAAWADLLAERAQHGQRRLHRALGRTLHQLHDIAQQDEALHVFECAQHGGQRGGPAQNVTIQPAAEMEVGYDERAHGGDEESYSPG